MEGRVQAPHKSARLSDVARLAEVSPGLVSRVLNEDPSLRVRPETRERVMSAIEMLHYTPHASARALRNSRTGLLGFALHHVNDPIYAEMIETAQSTAAQHGYSIVMLNADELAGPHETSRGLVRGHRVDGLLVQAGYAEGTVGLRELVTEIPSVIFNANPLSGLRTLRLDDTEAAAVATRHLIDAGHTSIGFVGAPGASSERRYEGYRDVLHQRGLPQPAPILGTWDADGTRQAITRYITEGGTATALVAVTTTSALGVHAGVTSAGLAIPDDISIVGIQDTWFAPHLNPALTTVALPLADLGQQAVDILLEQIRLPSEGETVLTDPAPEIIERDSVGPHVPHHL
jgi:LacI family transcriptional regulator